MTFLSVFFYTIYNFIFTLIENDIEGATVLGTRGKYKSKFYTKVPNL